MSVTITIAHHHSRDANLPRIVADLRTQSVSTKIFVWNNGMSSQKNLNIDWWIDSSRNIICAGRWWLSAQADTEYCALLDNDLTLKDTHVLRDCIAAINRLDAKVIGPTGVIFTPGEQYRNSNHFGLQNKTARGDLKVDIIKGRFVFYRTEDLRRILPAVLSGDAEDIHICSLLGGCYIPSELSGRFVELSPGTASACTRPEHYPNRQKAREIYFPHTV